MQFGMFVRYGWTEPGNACMPALLHRDSLRGGMGSGSPWGFTNAKYC
jgi:hypothetical protein